MDNLVWRSRARVVACFGLFLSILSVLFTVLITIALLTMAAQDIIGPMWAVVLVLVIVDIIAGVELWASLKLVIATEPGMTAEGALEKSRFWLYVNAFVLGLNIVNSLLFICIIGFTFGWIIVWILSYGIFSLMIFVVFKFIQELEMIVK